MAPSFTDLPPLEMAVVSNDHTTFGLMAAFCRDSMRRDAITGTKVEFALRKEN